MCIRDRCRPRAWWGLLRGLPDDPSDYGVVVAGYLVGMEPTPMTVQCFAVAIAVPDDPAVDPVEYGGRIILDALSLHGTVVAGVAHHRDSAPLFPDGIPGQN